MHNTRAMLVRMLSVGAILLLAGWMSACGSKVIIPTAPMPSGGSFDGRWYSNYGRMHLHQSGNEVTGTFDYKDGGTIAGTVTGGVLEFDWVQTGDLAVGRREVAGKGYFVLKSNDGIFILEGEYGFDDKYTGGGAWTAEWLGEHE